MWAERQATQDTPQWGPEGTRHPVPSMLRFDGHQVDVPRAAAFPAWLMGRPAFLLSPFLSPLSSFILVSVSITFAKIYENIQ